MNKRSPTSRPASVERIARIDILNSLASYGSPLKKDQMFALAIRSMV